MAVDVDVDVNVDMDAVVKQCSGGLRTRPFLIGQGGAKRTHPQISLQLYPLNSESNSQFSGGTSRRNNSKLIYCEYDSIDNNNINEKLSNDMTQLSNFCYGCQLLWKQ